MRGSSSNVKRKPTSVLFGVAVLVLVAVAILAVGCGGSGTSSSTTASTTPAATGSPLGQGPYTTDAKLPSGVTKASDLKIAFFSFGSSNSYLQAGIKGAQDAGAKNGVKVTVFDGKVDSLTQVNQMQTAIASGNYNAYVIEAVDGNAVTPLVKNSIAQQQMLVAAMNIPLENRELNEGPATRMPGTVTYVGGQTHDIYVTWVSKIIDLATKAFPNGGTFANFTGPKTGSNAKNQDDVVNTAFADTNFKEVVNSEQDYTTEKAYTTAVNILQANPKLSFFISSYTGMTQGIEKAVEQTGRQGTVKIYDMGGNEWALNAVKSGTIEMTMMLLPYTEAYDSVQALVDYANGTDVPQFVNLTLDPSLPGTPFVEKANVNEFKAEYQ